MDNIDGWIYIVLLVIIGGNALIGSLFKKSFKKQTNDSTVKNPSIDPILKESYKNKPVETKMKSDFSPIVSTQEEQLPDRQNKYQTTTLTESKFQLRTTEELKKAVIYSEILNRKY